MIPCFCRHFPSVKAPSGLEPLFYTLRLISMDQPLHLGMGDASGLCDLAGGFTGRLRFANREPQIRLGSGHFRRCPLHLLEFAHFASRMVTMHV